MTSSSDSDSRKRTRAEQNREKMKAYHRRVMQQREALTSVLTDMSAHVGAIPLATMRTASGGLLGSMMGETSTAGSADGASGSSSMASQDATHPNQAGPSRCATSKSRNPKLDFANEKSDQVYELGLYANYATATLTRAAGGDGANRGDQDGQGSTPWRQLRAHQMVEADVHMSHAILRVSSDIDRIGLHSYLQSNDWQAR